MAEQLELRLHFPPTVVPTGRADGAVMVIPGKPVVEDALLTVKQAAELTGYSVRRIHYLARQMGARQRAPRCKIRIPASEVLRLRQLRA